MSGLSPPYQKALALALLVMLLWLLYRVLLGPWFESLQQSGATLARLEKAHDVYQRLAAQEQQLQDKLQALQASNPAEGLYLSETKEALAAARLQQLINGAVEQGGGQLISTQTVQRYQEGGLPQVTVAVHLRGEIQELVSLLYTLESNKPLLFLENLTINANPRRQTARGSRRNVQQLPSLDIRFELTGFMSKEKP
ncbi:type II secretion system protein GspM [Gallaecimonas sp. GXIMD4217]|uniref:type II secretion system protein GspM n=1 Tax=Gallaecimonas sp. GXIMD4217 TaxID=3131927 RepID=UPI00311AD9D5